MPPKGRKPAKLWSLQPKLHDSVAQLLDEEGLRLDFFGTDDEQTNIEEWDTNVMGRFICRNSRCHSSGWSSKKIAITIRMYPRQQYNARVYHQRCKHCRAVGRPVLDTQCYAERVTYWLKRWNGIEVQRPDYSGESKGPHDRALCEGCKVGHCPDSQRDLAFMLSRLSI
ncbi:zinc-binding domain-containing protein [Aspergillus unguis]